MKKKTKRTLYHSNSTSDMEYSKIIKIAVGVIIVLGIVYLVTAIANGEIKLKKDKEEVVETSIQYEEIIAGEVLNRNDEEYYVLLFNFTDTFARYYLSSISSYNMKDNSLPFYIVDLEKKTNLDIVSEDNNIKEYPNSIEELKVASPTILKIRNHTVVGRIVDRDGILKFFDENK